MTHLSPLTMFRDKQLEERRLKPSPKISNIQISMDLVGCFFLYKGKVIIMPTQF